MFFLLFDFANFWQRGRSGKALRTADFLKHTSQTQVETEVEVVCSDSIEWGEYTSDC